jgi:hypothetical protein
MDVGLMGAGAAKKLTPIPTNLTVNIYSSDALLGDTLKKLGNVIEVIMNGSEDPAVWKAYLRLSDLMRNEAQQYHRDLMALDRHMNKG